MEKGLDSRNAVLGKSCQGKLQVPTEEEKEALDEMKSIKERVRLLKQRLRASGRDEATGETQALEKELAYLKVEWDEWEQKRQKATTERMILLGHEKE